jgi:hypothetical protein
MAFRRRMRGRRGIVGVIMRAKLPHDSSLSVGALSFAHPVTHFT